MNLVKEKRRTHTLGGVDFRQYIETDKWWYIYILKLELIKGRSKFYGKSMIYYTGITLDIGRRMGDHLHGRGDSWIQRYWVNSIKIPIYIEPFYGTEYDAMKREKTIKHLGQSDKQKLMKSDKNILKGYKPLKHLIIKKTNTEGEIVIKIK